MIFVNIAQVKKKESNATVKCGDVRTLKFIFYLF